MSKFENLPFCVYCGAKMSDIGRKRVEISLKMNHIIIEQFSASRMRDKQRFNQLRKRWDELFDELNSMEGEFIKEIRQHHTWKNNGAQKNRDRH